MKNKITDEEIATKILEVQQKLFDVLKNLSKEDIDKKILQNMLVACVVEFVSNFLNCLEDSCDKSISLISLVKYIGINLGMEVDIKIKQPH